MDAGRNHPTGRAWAYAASILAASSLITTQTSAEPEANAPEPPPHVGVEAVVHLQAPFRARSPWTLTVTRGPPPPDLGEYYEGTPGPLTLCLRKAPAAGCDQVVAVHLGGEDQDKIYDDPTDFRSPEIRATPRGLVLLIHVASRPGGNGDRIVQTQALAYDRASDRFRSVFVYKTGQNRNEDIRFLAKGPLAGAIVTAEPTDNAPFGYWVQVFRWRQGYAYSRVLKFRSSTRYGDNNPLAVIDSEMPNILGRLGLWRTGQPLPAPDHCPKPHLVKGALWCR
jgi:hypothetical protein